jgi:hypothetical protein
VTGTESAGRRIDTSRPHPARVYDWFLGGKDNYPVDEELGRRITAQGDAPRQARANRRFMERATRVAVREAGIRQFLDIGSGIPTEPNLHQIAQSAVPDARVVYVDNDPIVLAHAAALLHGTPEGATHYLQADAREPQRILQGASAVLDFEQPVALSLVALLHFISDEDGAQELVDTLVGALAPGSCLVLSAMTADFDPEKVNAGIAAYTASGVTLVARSHDEVSRLFKGLEVLEPGIVSLSRWRPDAREDGDPVSLYGAVGIKR